MAARASPGVLKHEAQEAHEASEGHRASEGHEGEYGAGYWYSSTDQVIVTRNRALLGWPRIAEAAEPIAERPGLPTFTDAHHNLLRILK